MASEIFVFETALWAKNSRPPTINSLNTLGLRPPAEEQRIRDTLPEGGALHLSFTRLQSEMIRKSAIQTVSIGVETYVLLCGPWKHVC